MAAVSGKSSSDAEEEIICSAQSSGEDGQFDAAVGVLEEALVSPEFKHQHDSWCRNNCSRIEPPKDYGKGGLSEGEFSLEAHAAFQEYTHMIEHHLESSLSRAIESAKSGEGSDGAAPMSMEELGAALAARAEAGDEPMDSEVFDLLFSLGDFGEFASLMLSWREQVEAEAAAGDGGGSGQVFGISVSSAAPDASEGPAATMGIQGLTISGAGSGASVGGIAGGSLSASPIELGGGGGAGSAADGSEGRPRGGVD